MVQYPGDGNNIKDTGVKKSEDILVGEFTTLLTMAEQKSCGRKVEKQTVDELHIIAESLYCKYCEACKME